MESQTSTGKRVERVRVVDDPPSDYLRFEISITPHNLAVGEDIRYLDRDLAGVADRNAVKFPVASDFLGNASLTSGPDGHIATRLKRPRNRP
mgnify:CR=1 FL=1